MLQEGEVLVTLQHIYYSTKDWESARLPIRYDYPSVFPFGWTETPKNRVNSYLAEEYGHEEEI